MTPAQKTLVQQSFARVAPISKQAAAMFYGRLFELDPQLRPLFRGDMKEQGHKLMQMLAVAVNGLDRLEEIVPAVQALGRRHLGYGVQDSHYDTVGEALLWTMQQGLGEAFTADTRQAWAEVYGLLAATMRAAATEVETS
jgi:hemoglobin-like flavoprotein